MQSESVADVQPAWQQPSSFMHAVRAVCLQDAVQVPADRHVSDVQTLLSSHWLLVEHVGMAHLLSQQAEPGLQSKSVWQAVCFSQIPKAQTSSSPQTLPQAPQLSMSLLRSRQLPAQRVWPEAQAHTPDWQVEVPGQSLPHEPQWSALVWRL